MGTPEPSTLAVYTLRVKREQLDRLAEIAAAEHRTLVQKLRVMIDAEIARNATPHQLPNLAGRRT